MKTTLAAAKKTIVAASVLLWAGSGCLSMQSQSTIDGVAGAVAQPFVEAYFEFPGPQAKWAGPVGFIMHVVAKDKGLAQVSVSPPLIDLSAVETRRPASQPAGMTGDQAREYFKQIALALPVGDQKFRGCMYPVRIRMMRADGSLVEKHGCRASVGWPSAVSEAVNHFIEVSTESGAAPPRSLASHAGN